MVDDVEHVPTLTRSNRSNASLLRSGTGILRQTWIEKGLRTGKWVWLEELLEEYTTYHLEPAQTKIHVGWPGYVALGLHIGIIVYVCLQVFTNNVYLQEIRPNGQFSFWAEGQLAARAQAQITDSSPKSICTYNTLYDYKYGLDNQWDYTRTTCQIASLDEIAVKSASSLQFVTFQHKRQVVRVKRKGPACEDECTQVYTDWPNASSYGDQQFAHISVRTEDDNITRAYHPGLPKVNNMLVKKPSAFGPYLCECWSQHNTFIAGADAAEFHFAHKYDSKYMAGSSKGKRADKDPTSFIVAHFGPKGPAEMPFRVIQRGKVNSFSLHELFEAFSTCLDCDQEDIFFMNALCPDGVCPEGYSEKPSSRVSGIAFDMQTEYYNNERTMPRGQVYDWVRHHPEHKPPYAFHMIRMVQDWTSLGTLMQQQENMEDYKRHTDTYRYGVLIRIKEATGAISHFDINVVLGWLVNCTVLLQFPGWLIGFVVLYGLGRRSEVYLKGVRKLMTVDDMYRSVTCSALVANDVFNKMDHNQNGFLDRDDLIQGFSKLLRPKLLAKQPDCFEKVDRQIEAFVDNLLMQEYHPEGKDGKPDTSMTMEGMSHSKFIKLSTYSHSLSWDDLMGKVMNLSIDGEVVEELVEQVSMKLRRSVSDIKGSDAKVYPWSEEGHMD